MGIILCKTNKGIIHVNRVNIGTSANNQVLLITPKVGNPDGDQTKLQVTNGQVSVDVSELPIFVLTQ